MHGWMNDLFKFCCCPDALQAYNRFSSVSTLDDEAGDTAEVSAYLESTCGQEDDNVHGGFCSDGTSLVEEERVISDLLDQLRKYSFGTDMGEDNLHKSEDGCPPGTYVIE